MKSSLTMIKNNRSTSAGNFLVTLDTAEDIDRQAVGGKALSLIQMKRIGLPVPPGFCIVSRAFEEHLKANDLRALIESTLISLSKGAPDTKRSLLGQIRQAIFKAPIEGQLSREIEENYRLLGAQSVAVRSSATAEDLPGNSFAGQYDTYLGVTNISDCLEAIKKCWASLWTERAYEYREKKGFDHFAVRMAVIVQTNIFADVSGVIFTVNPVGSDSNTMMIEACYGLGQILVDGKIIPDRIVANRDELDIVTYEVAEKRIECVLKENGEGEERIVSKERASTPCIDEPIVRRLVEIAKRAETELGAPQDMEWTISGNKIFVLQSRPITTLQQTRSWEDRQIWTNANLGEIVPDVTTPASWSMVQVLVDTMFGSIFGWVGIDLGDNPLVGQVAGRAYFNMNTLSAALKAVPGVRKMDISEVLGGEQGKMEELGELVISAEDLPDLKFVFLRMIFKLPIFFLKALRYVPKRGKKYLQKLKKKTERLRDLELNTLSEEEIIQVFQSAIDDVLNSVGFLASSAWGMLYYTKLVKVCKKWLGDTDGTLANQLLAGIGGMDSADAGLALWNLAAQASTYPQLEEIILTGDEWEITRKKIEGSKTSNGFLEGWDEFMTVHGHHARGELELANPRWSERPDYVLEMLRGYLVGINHADFQNSYQKCIRKRIELTKQCSRNLKNPVKRMIFNFYLTQAQEGCVIRENIKSVAVQYWMAVRLMLLELGRRLKDRGILDRKEDAFFLDFEEIRDVSRGEANFDIKKVIAFRQAEYRKNLSITPPKVVVGKFDSNNYIPVEVEKSLEVLSGMSVSPGTVTGRARVILKSDDGEQVLPGEILVAPFTDPGWTPYFITAAAIVMDQGGLLSHGSIIAREYGIPAVVNVGAATKIIKTGQLVQVDGKHGLVKILPE